MIQRFLIALIPVVLAGCSAVSPGELKEQKPPTLAQGHIAQITLASSTINEGLPILAYAQQTLDKLVSKSQQISALVEERKLADANSQLIELAEINDPRNSASQLERPGLRTAIQRALYHTQQASLARDASDAIQRRAPEIWDSANAILEDVNTLTDYINESLSSGANDTLQGTLNKIQALARQIDGRNQESQFYSLASWQEELDAMLSSSNEDLNEKEIWYFRNFQGDGISNNWRFVPQSEQ